MDVRMVIMTDLICSTCRYWSLGCGREMSCGLRTHMSKAYRHFL